MSNNCIILPQRGAEGDTHLDAVGFLALFEGAQGSQLFPEEHGIPLQLFGNAKIERVTSDLFGKGYLRTSSSPASYLKYLATPRTGRGMVGDFTIEMWAYSGNMSNAQAVLSNYDGSASSIEIAFNGGRLWVAAGANQSATPVEGFANGRWSHFAMCRKGNNIYMFVDGTIRHSSTTASVNEAGMSSFTDMGIGARPNGQIPLNGGISNLRITAGVCRYDQNFSRPTQPFSLA